MTTDMTWGHDADGQLLSEAYASTASGEGYTDVFAYDLAGNRTAEVRKDGNGNTVETVAYTYDGDDQLAKQVSSTTGETDFRYDANGSQTSSTTGSAVTTYVFDVRNKMMAVQANGTTTATYVYDDAGDRVQEVAGGTVSLYLTDGQNPTGYAQPLEVRTGSTAAAALASAAPATTYLLGGRVFGQADRHGRVTLLLVDAHGSTQQTVATGCARPAAG